MIQNPHFISSVVIKDYDSIWPSNYEYEANVIQDILKSNLLDVHHIGSTSVPGLEAKPIIDILVVVKDLKLIDSQKELLKVSDMFGWKNMKCQAVDTITSTISRIIRMLYIFTS
jgi:GrpB-like predicted nucleotidyltransferase (UPF0157 family)